MNVSKPMFIGIAAIAIIILVWILFFSGITGFSISPNYDEFAKCLSENGVKMYGTSWCTHCISQKKMFGDSWQYVNYIECSTPDGEQTEFCKNAGITGYPTWEFGNGARISGELTLEQLSRNSGCKLNK